MGADPKARSNQTQSPSSNAGATEGMARDYSVFDAELAGQVFNHRLLFRLLGWLRPYLPTVVLGVALTLSTAVIAVLMPVVISLVAIDTILFKRTDNLMPDFGLQALVIRPMRSASSA